MSYPGVPAWIRISDAPATHSGIGGDKTAGEKRKRSFPWNHKLLSAAAKARASGANWKTLAEFLTDKTGRQISPDAVANRVLRFEEEEEAK
jgi:hypothetical protein